MEDWNLFSKVLKCFAAKILKHCNTTGVFFFPPRILQGKVWKFKNAVYFLRNQSKRHPQQHTDIPENLCSQPKSWHLDEAEWFCSFLILLLLLLYWCGNLQTSSYQTKEYSVSYRSVFGETTGEVGSNLYGEQNVSSTSCFILLLSFLSPRLPLIVSYTWIQNRELQKKHRVGAIYLRPQLR